MPSDFITESKLCAKRNKKSLNATTLQVKFRKLDNSTMRCIICQQWLRMCNFLWPKTQRVSVCRHWCHTLTSITEVNSITHCRCLQRTACHEAPNGNTQSRYPRACSPGRAHCTDPNLVQGSWALSPGPGPARSSSASPGAHTLLIPRAQRLQSLGRPGGG